MTLSQVAYRAAQVERVFAYLDMLFQRFFGRYAHSRYDRFLGKF